MLLIQDLHIELLLQAEHPKRTELQLLHCLVFEKLVALQTQVLLVFLEYPAVVLQVVQTVLLEHLEHPSMHWPQTYELL